MRNTEWFLADADYSSTEFLLDWRDDALRKRRARRADALLALAWSAYERSTVEYSNMARRRILKDDDSCSG
jgi:hypothetical protein